MLTKTVRDKLLSPIAKARVAHKPTGRQGLTLAHVPTYEVIAHLIRIFDFCKFEVEILDEALVCEEHNKKNPERWDVTYKARVRLHLYFNADSLGRTHCFYDGVSAGTAVNQTRGDAHDLALKSAASTALKRAAIHLGDQFGLSLYKDGSTEAVVQHIFAPDLGKDQQSEKPLG